MSDAKVVARLIADWREAACLRRANGMDVVDERASSRQFGYADALTACADQLHAASIAAALASLGVEGEPVAWMLKDSGYIVGPERWAGIVKNQSDEYKAGWTPLYTAEALRQRSPSAASVPEDWSNIVVWPASLSVFQGADDVPWLLSGEDKICQFPAGSYGDVMDAFEYIANGKLADPLCRHELATAEVADAIATPPTGLSAEEVEAVDFSADARDWGNALNDAAWSFTNEYGPDMPPFLFNNCKRMVRAAILKYAESLAAATPPTVSEQGVVTEEMVSAAWEAFAKDWHEDFSNFPRHWMRDALQAALSPGGGK